MIVRWAVVGAACMLAFHAYAAELTPEMLTEGRLLFNGKATPACAACHTLADAQAEGAIGPSLDTLKPDAQRVASVLRSGLGVMPSYEALSAEQIETLARYVAQVTHSN